MAAYQDRIIVVTGATGLQGGAVARQLLHAGWRVRALTRNPQSAKAKALADLGAEGVQGDMADPDTLLPVFAGAYGVFSVQNPVISGVAGEIQQGKNVADVAQKTGVQHLVYSSAGLGTKHTGIPSWESKQVIVDYMQSLGLPLTILRLTAFMELMTDPKFFPAVSTWQLMPKLMGSTKKVPWISTEDLGIIVAKVFAEQARFIGQTLQLASDIQSIDACRAMYQEIMGKRPSRFPMPIWLFEQFGFIGKDLSIMWRWLGRERIDGVTDTTLAIHPQALSVPAWLAKQKNTKVKDKSSKLK